MSKTTAQRERVAAVINEMHTAGIVKAEDGTAFALREFAISRDHGAVLAAAARAVAPTATVETGCASGLSTLYMCRGRLEAGCLTPRSAHTIDLKQTSHWRNLGRRTIERAGLDDAVRFYEEAAHSALPRLLEAGVRIQFAFLDGWHMLDYVMLEAFYCDLMLEPGGVIALHDMFMPALRYFAAYWCANRHYEPLRLEGEALVGRPLDDETAQTRDVAGQTTYYAGRLASFVDRNILLLRRTSEDIRPWDYFRSFT
ncbi:MAG: O-methyltransferase [Planctomycetota bacterium]